MSLQREFRSCLGSPTLEHAHISQEFHSGFCANISDSQLQTPKNDDGKCKHKEKYFLHCVLINIILII